MTALFVYGTLAPNASNHHIMTPIDGTWQKATITATLLPNGFGRATGYPAVILAGKQTVDGFVFVSPNLASHWQRLDEFEGEGYERVNVMATLATGETINAFVYALAQKERLDFVRQNPMGD